MNTRREFLLSAASAALFAGCDNFNHPHFRRPRLAAQLWSIHQAFWKDPAGCMAGLKAAGYDGVEFAGYEKHTAKEIRKYLDDAGMLGMGTHVNGDVDLGRFNVALRERWQYTYRPEHSTTRYDFDNEYMEDCQVHAKGKHVLRSRLKLEYNIPHCKFTPAVSVEAYTGSSLEKTRFVVGGSYTHKKHHSFELGYHYQLYNHTVKPEAINTHHIVMGYAYKF